jgi:hypothetical protein
MLVPTRMLIYIREVRHSTPDVNKTLFSSYYFTFLLMKISFLLLTTLVYDLESA